MEMVSQDTDFVDLHIHTTASDGSLTPLEVLDAAAEIGLKAIAITDHDTIEGIAEVWQTRRANVIEVLPGIEISADYPFGTMHILGYLIRLDDMPFRQALHTIQEARAIRNLKIIERLQELGVPIRYEEVLEVSGGGQVGRLHISQVLVYKGVTQTVDEAFSRLLKKGGHAYVQRYRLSPADAIQTILQAGGVPVLAHPFTLNAKNEVELENILLDLKQVGLKGMEVYYPQHGPVRTAEYERLTRRHGLLMTGGTDFHGAVKPGVHLGTGKGDMRIPYRLVEQLKNKKCP